MRRKSGGPGGVRPGAGRPAGTGKFGEPTRTVRVPEGVVPTLVSYLKDYRLARLAAAVPSEGVALAPPELRIGMAPVNVPAGVPMPADEHYAEEGCDFNRLLVRKPEMTRIFTVEGDSMNLAGIHAGDKLVVDRSLQAREGDIVIAIVLGEGHTVKRFSVAGGKARLIPESSNPVHKVRTLGEHDEWLIWGVVTGAVKQFR